MVKLSPSSQVTTSHVEGFDPRWYWYAAFGVAYTGALMAGYAMFFSAGVASMWWPAMGIVFAALLVTSKRCWLAILFVTQVCEVLVDVSNGLDWQDSLLYRPTSIAAPLIATWLVRRFEPALRLDRLRHTLTLVGAGLVGTSVGALGGALVFVTIEPSAAYDRVFVVWWLADVLGMLVVTPAILNWAAHARRPRGTRRPTVTTMAIVVGVGLLAHGIASQTVTDDPNVFAEPYWLMPVLVVSGILAPPAVVTSMVLAVVVIFVGNTAQGLGWFAALGLESTRGVLSLQVFIAVISCTTLVGTSVLAEHHGQRRSIARGESLLEALFESLPSGLAVLDVRRGGHMVMATVNSAFVGQYAPERSLDGRPLAQLQDCVAAEAGRALASDYRACFERGEALRREHTWSSPTGPRHMIHQVTPLRDDGGRVFRVIGVTTEVTELKESVRALLQAQSIARLGTIHFVRESGRVTLSNVLFEVFGVRPEDFDGTWSSLRALVHPEDIERVEEAHRGAMDNDASFRFANRACRPDGEVRVVESIGEPLRDPHGMPIGTVTVVRDITDVRRAELVAERRRRELVDAEKLIALGTLVAGVAHEVNNPNHYIMLNLPWLAEAVHDLVPLAESQAGESTLIAGLPFDEALEEVPRVIEQIGEGAKRIRAIVAELRGFAVSGSDEAYSDVNLNEVVEGALRLIDRGVKEATDDFEVELASHLEPVRGQRLRLEQVVMNLVLNSCQALTSRAASIRVTTRGDDEHVVLTVADEGCGMDEATVRRTRDPFFTTKRDRGGMGLGLAVVQRIVADHHGHIDIQSQRGHGTTVTVTLQVRATAHP